jgi:hypothetical protein
MGNKENPHNIFGLFFILISLCSIFSQKIIYPFHTYSVKNPNFQVLHDRLFLRMEDRWEVWNITNQKIIAVIPWKALKLQPFMESEVSDYVSLTDTHFYFHEHNTVEVTIGRYSNYSVTNTTVIPNCILWGPWRKSSKLLHVPCFHPQSTFEHRLFDIENFVEKDNFFFPNNELQEGFVVDENDYFYVKGNAKLSYNLHRYSFDKKYKWITTIDECIGDSYIPLAANYRYVFMACNNLVFQVDKETSSILRKIPISGFSAKQLIATDKYLFVVLYNSNILQLTLDAEYVAYYKSNNKADWKYFFSFSNNFLVGIQVRTYDSVECSNGLEIIQFKVVDVVDEISYIYQASPSFEINPKLSIKHNNYPSPTLINTGTYLNRFKKISKFMAQNSFIKPVMIPSVNKTWDYLYFSGAGSVKKGLCGDNYLHKISISTFDLQDNSQERNLYRTNEYYIVSLPTVICGEQINDNMEYSSSIYDYASVLIRFNGLYYYLIHGGCSCYLAKKKASLLLVEINGKFGPKVIQIDQSITLFS